MSVRKMRLQLSDERALYADMTYASKIIDMFGGVRPMATAIGRKPSTVMSWKTRGSIPDANKPAILAKAIEQGMPLGPEDFFPVEIQQGAA